MLRLGGGGLRLGGRGAQIRWRAHKTEGIEGRKVKEPGEVVGANDDTSDNDRIST